MTVPSNSDGRQFIPRPDDGRRGCSSGATNSVTVDSTKGMTEVPFPNPGKTGVISVRRQDAGEVIVGYEVS